VIVEEDDRMQALDRRCRMRPGFRSASLAIVVIAAGAAPLPARADDVRTEIGTRMAQAAHAADCICRAQGRTYAVGESACLRTTAGPRIADCGMVLNNTSWLFTERPCPES
jgi:hypothetical protein